jgi:Family of unknown function (DUF6489)
MKITIDVDCTPEEARRFLGLPDVGPMQDQLLAELGRRMKSNLESMDPEALMKTWLPAGLQGLESAQKMFWSQISQAAARAGKTDKSGGT